jgi:hypothetical protein
VRFDSNDETDGVVFARLVSTDYESHGVCLFLPPLDVPCSLPRLERLAP